MSSEKKQAYPEKKKRHEIILEYAPHIKYISNRLALRLPPHIDISDVINSGIIGLIDAIEKYDESKGVKFKTYAEFRIRGAILDNLRELDWVPRSIRKTSTLVENTYVRLEKDLGRPATDDEAAEAMNVSIEEFHRIISQTSGITLLSLEMISNHEDVRLKLIDCLTDDEGNNPLSVFGIEELGDIVAEAINSLPEKEKLVISLYYFDDLNMREISKTLKLTESRVSQLHAKAILRLRGKLRENL